jgi:hypothetical protein
VQTACMQFFLKSKKSITIIDLKRKKKRKKKVKIGNDSPHVGSMRHTLLGDEIRQ